MIYRKLDFFHLQCKQNLFCQDLVELLSTAGLLVHLQNHICIIFTFRKGPRFSAVQQSDLTMTL